MKIWFEKHKPLLTKMAIGACCGGILGLAFGVKLAHDIDWD